MCLKGTATTWMPTYVQGCGPDKKSKVADCFDLMKMARDWIATDWTPGIYMARAGWHERGA